MIVSFNYMCVFITIMYFKQLFMLPLFKLLYAQNIIGHGVQKAIM